MKRTKRQPRRNFSDEQKRAIVAEITPKNRAAAVARKHRLQWATVKAWQAKYGAAPSPAALAPATNGKAAANGNGAAPTIQIQGLDGLVRALVADELARIVEGALPAALDRALARAYGGKGAT